MYPSEPAEVDVGFIKAVYAVRYNVKKIFGGGDFVLFGRSNSQEFRDHACVVKIVMKLNTAFGLPELGPGKNRQAKVNRGGIQSVQGILKFKTMFGRHFPAAI